MSGTPPYLSELLSLQASDGGWPAEPGGPASTEPTAWALAALRPFAGSEAARGRGLEWLERTRFPGRGWASVPDLDEPDAATAPAVLALARLGGHADAVRDGAAWLLKVREPANGWVMRIMRHVLDVPDPSGIDDALEGWSWNPGMMTWVEPTAVAMMALRAAAGLSDPKTVAACVEGAQLLLDRTCPDGGWNYGNPEVLGVPLPGYPDTTAWALLALHPTHRGHQAVRRGLDWLWPAAQETGSGLALALAALVAQRYGARDGELLAQARAAFAATAFCGDVRALALALLAEAGQAGFVFA